MFDARIKLLAFVLICSTLIGLTRAQEFVANYDESKVPDYTLPPIIDSQDSGESFQTAWKLRRKELLDTFSQHMFGYQPKSSFQLKCEKLESGPSVGGKALRQQYRVSLGTDAGSQVIHLLVFTPANSSGPVPCFLGLNFRGNHTVAADPEIVVTQSWSPNDAKVGATNNTASEAGRGAASSRWPVEMLVDAGCGVATAYCGDIDPDFHDGFNNGVHALFPDNQPSEAHPDRWGTISAWAWGLSRLLDCIQTNVPEVDGHRVAVVGHSRLGKTSLWAGATDERFAAVISNDSGCGGAAISRRAFGETVGRINTSFPHWFCPNFKQYNLNEQSLPIDQHQLVALAAPRPVYVASASEDQWADPRGEFLSAKLAGQLYQRLGLPPLAMNEFPAHANTGVVGTVSYHLRDGKHDINAYDWTQYIKFISQLK
ncbi:MAG: acetylxylan esterase [Planctomycetales bacterium]|nr:acetylxylan esterase [Planctomycetales bacterium]